MPAEIAMPQLSDTMSEGTLVKWLKKEGEKVRAGEEIAEVETDKATMPMEAFDSGTLAAVLVQEGDKIPVGQVMGVIALDGEDVQQVKQQYAQQSGRKATARPRAAKAEAPRQPAPAAQPQRAGASRPPVRHDDNEGGAEGASSHDTEMGRQPLEEGRAQSRRESVQTGPEHTAEAIASEAMRMSKSRREARGNGREERILASPLARRIAQQMGVDLSQVKGSGPRGRIVQKDVLEAAEKPQAQAKPAPAPSAPVAKAASKAAEQVHALRPQLAEGATEIVTLSKMRSIIAQRLQHSKQSIPHFYETIEVDVEELSALRARLNAALEKEGTRLSLQDLLVRGLCTALKAVPALNATFDGREITRHGDVHLGIAVALPDGLIVPVLRNASRMGLRELRTRSAELIERARQLRLRQEEMTGATFTISNLGQYGIREFSAIINPPEVAILAIGTAEKRPVVNSAGQIVARTMMNLTVSCDHRVVDGAVAAEFMRTLKQILEEPGMMLV